MHIHTQTHIEDSGARVEQPWLLVPSELGNHSSFGSVSWVGWRVAAPEIYLLDYKYQTEAHVI